MATPFSGVVLTGGSSRRMGADKAVMRIAPRGEVLAAIAMRALVDAGAADVVCIGGDIDALRSLGFDAHADDEPGADVVVPGGATRSGSVRAGLAAVPDGVDVIVVHDAARPVPMPEGWDRVLAAVATGADAAVPCVPVTDTLRVVGGSTAPRERFVAVQTPQAFRAASLRAAHVGDPEGTDDASLVEAGGGRVVVVDGDPANIKITTPTDLLLAELLCRQ